MHLPGQHRHPAVETPAGHCGLDRLLVRHGDDGDTGRQLAGADPGRGELGRGARDADSYDLGGAAAGEGQSQDRRHQERRGETPDEDGAIAETASELVPRDDADQSRSSFPVSLKKTSSRLGERTSTPVRSTPCRDATATTAERTAGPWSVVSSRWPSTLVHVVDVVELATGGGQLVEGSGVAGQMHLVPSAVLPDERIGRAFRDEVTVVDDADPVAQLGRFLHVVRRVEDGDAEPPDGLEDGVAALRVDAHRGLVEDEQLGPMQEAGRHVGPPFHATRVGSDAVLPPIGQSDQLERLADAPWSSFPVSP